LFGDFYVVPIMVDCDAVVCFVVGAVVAVEGCCGVWVVGFVGFVSSVFGDLFEFVYD